MRVGIDARALTGRYTGDRTYWTNLLRNHVTAEYDKDVEYILYSRLPLPVDALPLCGRVRTQVLPAPNDRLWTLVAFPKALRRDGADVAHTQYTIPLNAPCPVVTTVHDISFRLYPDWFPRKHRILLNLTVPLAIKRAARVITVSFSSRRDILRVYRPSPERVEAIPLAAAPHYRPLPSDTARKYVEDRFGLAQPYVVFVGVLQPRKNVPMLIEAFARAVYSAHIPHKLVLVGKAGWAYDEVMVQIARLGLADRVLVTDYVEDADLPYLYSAADIMAFPSLYEGFGLPPLEAMACGTPTLVSDAPAMPEVAADGARVLPVMDSAVWGEAIAELALSPDKRRKLTEAGLARSRAYSWDATASLTRNVYRDVLIKSSLQAAA